VRKKQIEQLARVVSEKDTTRKKQQFDKLAKTSIGSLCKSVMEIWTNPKAQKSTRPASNTGKKPVSQRTA